MMLLERLTMELFWQGTAICVVIGCILMALGYFIAKQPVKEKGIRARTKPSPYRVMLESRRTRFH